MKTYAPLFVVLSLFYSCSKNPDNLVSPAEIPKPIDSSVIHLNSAINISDSFEVKFPGKWTLAVNPTNVSWLNVSAASGSGKTKVYVKATAINTTSVKRDASILITPEDQTLQAVTITISQDTYSYVSWSRLYGGSLEDRFRSSVKTPDGGFLILGSTESSNGDVSLNRGELDIWLVKIDAAGNKIWEKTYGSAIYDEGIALIPVPAGGYIVSGGQWNSNGVKPLIIKIDETGTVEWQKSLDIPSNEFLDFKPISTGGYVGCGYDNRSDGFLFKIDNNGDLAWFKTYGGTNFDRLASVVESIDGGLVVTGNTENSGPGPASADSVNIWVIKTDADGNLQWNKQFGGTALDFSGVVISTKDGGSLVASSIASSDGDITVFHGENDIWVFKLEASGNLVWQKTIGGQGGEIINSIVETNAGSFLLAGFTSSSDGDVTQLHGTTDAWIIKLNSGGQLVNQKTFGGDAWNAASSIMKTSENKYLILGSTASNKGDFSLSHGGADAWIFTYEDR